MNLKLSSNLFLGFAELTQLKESLKQEGYEKLFKQIVTSYGVSKPLNVSTFSGLQVSSSGAGQLSIKAGIAIDNNLNIIDVVTDQVDALTIAGDDVQRFVIISYKKTVVEEGTISVAADGTVTGTGTQFTKRLRGQSNFPSRIVIVEESFDPAVDTPTEFEVQAIQNDTLASLNVASGVVEVVTDKKYAIVGSFTPGIVVPDADKYPLELDGYTIDLRLSSSLIEDQEFILAEVQYDGVTLTINDRRDDNIFSVLDLALEAISSSNPVIGVQSIKDDQINAVRDRNLVEIGWGFKALSGNWTISPALQELQIQQGAGGIWDSINQFTADDLDDWRIVFEKTGQIVKIQTSVIGPSSILFTLDFDASYPVDGNIYVVPNCDLVEIKITNITNPTANQELIFTSKQGFAIIPIEAGSTSNIQYRHIKGDQATIFRNINDGDYLSETSFNDNGTENASPALTTYTDGNVLPVLNTAVNPALLDRVLDAGFIIDFFGTLIQAEAKVGFIICDGRLVSDSTSIFDGQNTPDLRGRVTVGHDAIATDYNKAGNLGGADKIQLVVNQLPAHTHAGKTNKDGAHTHEVVADGGSTFSAGSNFRRESESVGTLEVDSTNSEHEHNFTTNETGANADIDIRQKFMVMHKLMKL